MTEKVYDDLISDHYRKVASKDGLEPTSTMADSITREKETGVIIEFIADAITRMQGMLLGQPAVIMDVGCGNGYTLDVLSKCFPDHTFIGIEKSDELRSLATTRFHQTKNVSILDGDIRDDEFSRGNIADILLCQRVLINLLDKVDQQKALSNIVTAVKPPEGENKGGSMLFIEAFTASLNLLNTAREEFDLPPISPAHHNLYLQDDFFNIPALEPYSSTSTLSPSNFLSTHYFVTRVLHPIMLEDRPFKRNSEFVKFFTQSLKENVGDYSPLRLMRFKRVD